MFRYVCAQIGAKKNAVTKKSYERDEQQFAILMGGVKQVTWRILVRNPRICNKDEFPVKTPPVAKLPTLARRFLPDTVAGCAS